MAKTKRKSSKSKVTQDSMTTEIVSIVFVAISIFFLISMWSDKGGALGSVIKNIFLGIFSISAYILPILFIAIGTNLIIEKKIVKYRYIYICISLITLSVVAAYSFFSPLAEGTLAEMVSSLYINGQIHTGGGVIAGLIDILLRNLIGDGALIVYIASILICLTVMFRFSINKFITGHLAQIKEKAKEKKEKKELEKINKKKKKDIEDIPVIGTQAEDEEEEKDENYIVIPEHEDIEIGPDMVIEETDTSDGENIDTVIEADNQVALDIRSKGVEEFVPENEYTYIENYEFPDIELLKPNKKSGKSGKEQDIKNNARKLVDTLASFGVQAQILQVSKGPAITRYELQPMAGVKVSKIVNLADDIALNLAAPTVRIEAPIPGKAAIGIEIPNPDIDMVSMREVIDTDEFRNHPSKLAVALGKDISGSPIIIDLAKMPHLLIAGATGSGKSVCINSIITSIMYKANPNEVKLLLIDPKVVELSVYNGIPHLDTPVVTKAKRAAGALSWAVTEMMRRYEQFSETKVRDIKGYNAAMAEKGYPLMPQVVIIIDELADLMMVAPNEVEDSICRLAQLARAAGMHLVIATQRPSVNVITGIIKANIPSRIAFSVSSQVDSRTILDMAGAEKLLGRGDMLYHPVGNSKPKRIQGAFVSDGEVESIVKAVKKSAVAQYNNDIVEHIEREARSDAQKEAQDNPGECDELLTKAIDIIMELGQASTSMIQRKLSVGYARAGRIMDQMEERGIVGPSQGSKPRDILLTREQYLELKANGDQTAVPKAEAPAPVAEPKPEPKPTPKPEVKPEPKPAPPVQTPPQTSSSSFDDDYIEPIEY